MTAHDYAGDDQRDYEEEDANSRAAEQEGREELAAERAAAGEPDTRFYATAEFAADYWTALESWDGVRTSVIHSFRNELAERISRALDQAAAAGAPGKWPAVSRWPVALDADALMVCSALAGYGVGRSAVADTVTVVVGLHSVAQRVAFHAGEWSDVTLFTEPVH